MEIVDIPPKKKKNRKPNKFKKRWLQSFIIGTMPPQLILDEPESKKKFFSIIRRPQPATDKLASFSVGNRFGAYFIMGFLTVIITPLFISGEITEDDLPFIFAIGIPFIIAISACIIYLIKTEAKFLYLNRLKGTMLAPLPFSKKYRRIIFKNAEVGKTTVTSSSGVTDSFITINNVRLVGPGNDADMIWAFHVWYMDKNRPLPIGTAFDEFRNTDFERRKAEGFPPPLYKSKVNTPEATQEQQKEREEYWKDEEFMV